jgi:murein DD-endopeptidase MepM/ murein hydrolase activator NlpD
MWRLAGQRAVIRKNAAAIYMQGGPWTSANALLNAKDLSAVRDVGTFAQIVLVNYIDVMHQIQKEKARLSRLYAAMRIRTAKAYARTVRIRHERDRVLVEWRQASAARDAIIRQLAHLGAPILKMFRASASQIKAMLVEAQRGERSPGRRYRLPWPVGGHISSRFGWRIHPIFHYRSFHTGIDIAGNGGRTVKSPASGRVLAARAMGAYGLAVVLDHGRAVGSVYAHLSSTFVRAGDRVRRGDVIGRVGCTGWCTGPHLHFEIWVGAEPRNPIFWLS